MFACKDISARPSISRSRECAKGAFAPVFASRETGDDEAIRTLYEKVKAHVPARYFGGYDEINRYLKSTLTRGDLAIYMGAGTINRAAEALVRTRPQFYLEGVQYLAKMPDVRTNLGALLEVFSDNEAARALIEPGSGKVTATLGEDIEPAMPNLCIVSKRYLAGGGLYGTVAVIGSNRMEYEHLIPVLNYFAIKLGQSMSGKKEEQT